MFISQPTTELDAFFSSNFEKSVKFANTSYNILTDFSANGVN